MYCTKCGKLLKEGQRYCTGCGAPVLKISINRTAVDNPIHADAGDLRSSRLPLRERDPHEVRTAEDPIGMGASEPRYSVSGTGEKCKTERPASQKKAHRSSTVSEKIGKSDFTTNKTVRYLDPSMISGKYLAVGVAVLLVLILAFICYPRSPEKLIVGNWNSVSQDYPDMNILENGKCYMESESKPYVWALSGNYLVLTSDYGFGYSDKAEIADLTAHSLILNIDGITIKYRRG